MIAPARVAVFDVLRAVHTGSNDLPGAIAAARARLNDDRDRALATDIATGVERHRNLLDHLIAHYAKRSIERLDAEVLEILRLSAYQLLHLTRVPASAVVHDAVQLARRAGKSSAAGFVNAVLRQLSRKRNALPLPSRPSDSADREAAVRYLTITGSHPAWLAERWLDRLGLDKAEAWVRFNNEAAPLTLRANTAQTSAITLRATLDSAGLTTHAGRFAPDAVVIDGGQLSDAAVDAAAYVIQDESSQLVTLLAGASPGPRLLDTCAAPGGKTTAFAGTLAPTGGLVVACDVRDRRVALLRRVIATAGLDNVRVVQADAAAGLPFDQRFATVVVDAPCSGLGTLRRDPDIKWRRAATDLPRLAAAQRAMLNQAARAVAPGGRLVYATCSTEPEENEAIVDAFLASAHDFTPLDARRAHPQLPSSVVDGRGHLRTTPDEHGLEGFFGAVFERSRQL
jgi:16S rRNA (cytosine967-C5)-methyltransferase